MNFIYLHGFASGPSSAKAILFQKLFQKYGIRVLIPDLNQPGFETLTVSRQLEQVEALMSGMEGPVHLVGSSMGGYLSTLLASRNPSIQSMILMAPAFDFLKRQKRLLGPEVLAHWEKTGSIEVDHYATGQKEKLSYGIIRDGALHNSMPPHHEIPVLIFHGIYDTVVPYGGSIRYLKMNPGARLKLYPSDHSLLDVGEEIVLESEQFLLGKGILKGESGFPGNGR